MAFGAGTINSLGGAASDLFSISAHHAKATGDLIEAQNYDQAGVFARQNEQFTAVSTSIKQAQLDRESYKMIGGQAADVAGAGFAQSGSALDIMRESASQGALTKAVGEQQGLITEAGYEEQAKSFDNMSKAAHVAADAENEAADNAWFTAGIKGATAIASLFT